MTDVFFLGFGLPRLILSACSALAKKKSCPPWFSPEINQGGLFYGWFTRFLRVVQWQSSEDHRRELALERHVCETGRRLHIHDARYAEKPSEVSTVEDAEARRGAADCACRGHHLRHSNDRRHHNTVRCKSPATVHREVWTTTRRISSHPDIGRWRGVNRPGRLEPRVLRRRCHGYKLMQKPRHRL